MPSLQLILVREIELQVLPRLRKNHNEMDPKRTNVMVRISCRPVKVTATV